MPDGRPLSMQSMQEQFYGDDVSYLVSPHLRHAQLRARLVDVLTTAARQVAAAGLPLRVLEIGAGHGGYTESALALGADVTAVEMSRPAIDVLTRRFATNPLFRGVFDPTGDLAVAERDYSLIMAVAVLHHIPDYLSYLRDIMSRLTVGGSLLSLQDPLWYPRVPSAQHRSERAAYFAWRIGQGELRTGAASLLRRLRGAYDDTKPGDMVEYHIVRNGVDEQAVQDLLTPHFDSVELIRYWSTALPSAQRFGERRGWANSFGVHAAGFRGLAADARVTG